jgi:hypothetical protein
VDQNKKAPTGEERRREEQRTPAQYSVLSSAVHCVAALGSSHDSRSAAILFHVSDKPAAARHDCPACAPKSEGGRGGDEKERGRVTKGGERGKKGAVRL